MGPTTGRGEGIEPELQEYRAQIEAIRRDAADLVRGLSPAQLTWRPDPGRWSIADCLFHLNATSEVYHPMLRAAMEKGRREGLLRRGPFRYGVFGRYFVRSLEPPVKMKVGAPKMMLPPPEFDPEDVVKEFLANQEGLIELIVEADGLDLRKVSMLSKTVRVLKLPLGQWFAFLAAHIRRHLWQARQVRNNPSFPS